MANVILVLLISRHGPMLNLPFRGEVEVWDIYLPVIAIVSAPAIGVAIEIAREQLSDGRVSLPYGTWPHRTIIGIEVVVILLSLYFAADFLIATFLGPVVDLATEGWTNVAGQTLRDRLPIDAYFASVAGFYLWGAVFFHYIRRERLSDLLPLTKYSGVFFRRDYAVLGLAITVSVTLGRMFRPLFITHVATPLFPALAGISSGAGLWFVAFAISISYVFLYLAAFVVPFILVGATAREIETLTTRYGPVCDTTSQSRLEDFYPEYIISDEQ
jgi:hypothetical protein